MPTGLNQRAPRVFETWDEGYVAEISVFRFFVLPALVIHAQNDKLVHVPYRCTMKLLVRKFSTCLVFKKFWEHFTVTNVYRFDIFPRRFLQSAFFFDIQIFNILEFDSLTIVLAYNCTMNLSIYV